MTLTAQSALSNRRRDLSGFLYFKEGHFLQYIEGPDHALPAVMKRISDDRRHRVRHRLNFLALPRRLFGQWAMRYYRSDPLVHSRLEDAVIRTVSEQSLQPTRAERDACSTRVLKLVARLARTTMA